MSKEEKRLKKELFRLLNKEVLEEIIVEKNPVPEKIKSEDIFWKTSHAISMLDKELCGNREWAGWIIAKKENPSVAIDIKLERQLSEPARVRIPANSVGKMMENLEKELTVVGIIHYFPSLHYFSPTDDQTIRNMVQEIAFNTEVISKYVELRTSSLGLAFENGQNIFVKEYDNLNEIKNAELKNYELSFLIKLKERFKSSIKDFKIFVPYLVGWCYNIIVCEKTVPESKDNINRCISVVEHDLFGFLPKKIDYYREIDIDEPIVTGKEVDMEKIKEEVKRCISTPSIFESVKSLIKKPEKEVEEKPKVEAEKPEVKSIYLNQKDFENFVLNIYRFARKIDKELLKELEERLGFQVYKEDIFDVVEKLEDYQNQHPEITQTIWEIATCNTPFWVEKTLREYLKK